MNLSSCPTTSKKASQAARKAAAATLGFPTPVPLSKVQALELLKGDLDRELYLELQSRLATPKVVLPKKKEDALLRKRIEKDKAKELQARLEQRLSNLKGELASVEAQAEENRQRVLVLQSEWQALYDKTGEDTDVMPENESVHEEGVGRTRYGRGGRDG